jgi:hypothetical protein
MARSNRKENKSNVKFHWVSNYNGIEIYQIINGRQFWFVIWLGRFYSSPVVNPLLDLVDAYWKTRLN